MELVVMVLLHQLMVPLVEGVGVLVVPLLQVVFLKHFIEMVLLVKQLLYQVPLPLVVEEVEEINVEVILVLEALVVEAMVEDVIKLEVMVLSTPEAVEAVEAVVSKMLEVVVQV